MRHAVVLLDSADDDFIAAPITSSNRVSGFDVPILQWREAGLNTASTIRVHKLTVLAKDEIVRRLGEIAHQVALDELYDNFVAQTVDVHGVASGKMEE